MLRIAAGHADAPAKPVVTIILEGGALLAGETMPLHVWVENPTDTDINNLALHYDGPGFVGLGTPDGTHCAHAPDNTVPLGALSAGQSRQARPLCLWAAKWVQELDIDFGLTLDYAPVKNGATPGFVVNPEKLSIGLFGTDSIDGVSLRLIAYVLPGFLFLMILRLGKLPLAMQVVGVADVATLSVAISLVLFTVAAWIGSGVVSLSAIGAPVSAGLFGVLCLVAAALGLLIVLGYQGYLHDKIRDEALVTDQDDALAALEKALRQHDDVELPVCLTTRATDNAPERRYYGSVAARTVDGGLALLGWFGVKPPAGPTGDRLKGLFAEKKMLEALRLALAAKIDVRNRNQIQLEDKPAGGRIKRFGRDEIEECVHVEPREAGVLAQDRPLSQV